MDTYILQTHINHTKEQSLICKQSQLIPDEHCRGEAVEIVMNKDSFVRSSQRWQIRNHLEVCWIDNLI